MHLLRVLTVLLLAVSLFGVISRRAVAQGTVQPGEAFVTRFSGTTTQNGRTVIDAAGTVGSVIDIRQPGEAAQGQHWLNELQRIPVTASDVGQVFGVTFDDASPPNIYLTATSAFGLHRTSDNSGWMTGMWGAKGGPGTVWKLNSSNDYKPELFANITLKGRANTGAALGNIAYDKWNRQLFVSDLETGMIHRLAITDGQDLGTYDHGVEARASFTDATTGTRQSLPKIAFDAKTKARVKNCPDGKFANTPACWNVADFRRRIWGLGVRRGTTIGEVRLYYAVWSSQGLGSKAFAGAADDEKRIWVWSVAVAHDGSFDKASIRREFLLPDFFTDKGDIARYGRSHPVSDIAFEKAGDQGVMLLAERGGLRNLGLGARAPFARPFESRVLRYELDANDVWKPVGRYDIGFYVRQRLGPPYLRANSAGGVDFGFGYDQHGALDVTQADKTVWVTGDTLCASDGPCADATTGKHDDISEVHGIQGMPEDAYEKITPNAALKPYPATGVPYPAKGPGMAYMVDVDHNVDTSGNIITAQMSRDDATKVGDVEIFGAVAAAPPTRPPTTVTPGYPQVYPPSVTPPGYPPGVIPPGYPPGAPPGPVGTDLAIKKTGPKQCTAGLPCKFGITVTNNSTRPYTGSVIIKDTMPTGWTFDSAKGPWACQQKGNLFSCGLAQQTLAAKKGLTLEFTLKPSAPVGPTMQVWNCAEIDWKGGRDSNPGNDADCAKVHVKKGKTPPTPKHKFDLKMEKVADKPTCASETKCTFTISITNNGSQPYKGSLTILDTLPSKYINFKGTPTPSAPWTCSAGWAPPRLHCWHPELTLPPNGTVKLTLTLHMKTTVKQDVTAENCVLMVWPLAKPGDQKSVTSIVEYILVSLGYNVGLLDGIADSDLQKAIKFYQSKKGMKQTGKIDKALLDSLFPGSAGKPHDEDGTNDRDCATVKVTTAQKQKTSLNLGAQGPSECTPPNCSFYEFTVTNDGERDYSGPVSLRVTLPEGARLLETQGTKSASSCASSSWSCNLSGEEVQCRPSACSLAPEEQSAVGLEIRLLPETSIDIPPGGITKTVCGDLQWSAPKEQGTNIEQLGEERHSRACVTTRILPPEKTVPPEKVTPTPQSYDLRMLKIGPSACVPGGTCGFAFTFHNVGHTTFSAPIVFTDELPSGWKMIPPDFMPCTQTGSRVTCTHPDHRLEHNWTETSVLDAHVPETETRSTVTNCAWYDLSTAAGDTNSTNDKSCWEIEIAPKVTTQPQPSCAQGEQWDPIEQACIPLSKPEQPDGETPRPDLAIQKLASPECRSPGNCVFNVRITNQGPGHFEAALVVSESAPPEWELYGGFPSPPWKCTRSHGPVTCEHDHLELPPGESIQLLVEFLIPPGRSTAREIENCVAIGWREGGRDQEAASIREVQERLNELGYEVGPVDGKIGRQTRAAISRYQREKDLPRSGGVDDTLLKSLFPHAAAPSADPNPSNDRSCATTTLVGSPDEQEERSPEPPASSEPQVKEEKPGPPAATPQPPKRRECPPGQSRNRAGQCVCPQGQQWDRRQERCVPRLKPQPVQPPPLQPVPGQVICPSGTKWHAPSKQCIRPPG